MKNDVWPQLKQHNATPAHHTTLDRRKIRPDVWVGQLVVVNFHRLLREVMLSCTNYDHNDDIANDSNWNNVVRGDLWACEWLERVVWLHWGNDSVSSTQYSRTSCLGWWRRATMLWQDEKYVYHVGTGTQESTWEIWRRKRVIKITYIKWSWCMLELKPR